MIGQSSIHQNRNVLHNSATNEWYTPKYIIESVRAVLGTIDLDPATNERAQRYIGAESYYTIETDGYDKPWYGKVWLNPPYGKVGITSSTELWLNKFISEYKAGNMTEGIAVFNAMVDKKWWHRTIVQFPFFILTTQGLSFIPGAHNSASKNIYASVFVYLGNNDDAFVKEFSQYGLLLGELE